MPGRAASVYSPKFFDHIRATSLDSARAAAPNILEVFRARSIIDVGCGIGTWLKVFRELGVARIAGLDGDFIDRTQLMIPAACFANCNLDEPLDLGDVYRQLRNAERFDLAISLEVGEHLSPTRGPSLVADLCALSDVVLFGAAIPFQGWQRAHINEQWQSYWANKFLQNGYDAFDALRPLIWSSPRIAHFYKQNAIFYVKRSTRPHDAFMARYVKPTVAMFDIVHPEHYRTGVERRKNGNFVQRFFNKYRQSGGKQRSIVLTTPLRGDDHWKLSEE